MHKILNCTIWICLVLLSCLTVKAQDLGDEPEAAPNTPVEFMGAAQSAIEFGDSYSAATYLQAYLEMVQDGQDAASLLGEVLLSIRDYEGVLQYLEKFQQDATGTSKAPFYYGLALKGEMQYQKAKEVLSKFRKNYRGRDAGVMKKLTKNEIEGCELAAEMIENPVARVLNVGSSVNTPYHEASPMLINEDEFLFNSTNQDSVRTVSAKSSPNKEPKSEFYRSKRNLPGWTPKELTFENIGQSQHHVGNISLSPDSSLVYFTICTEKKHGNIRCHIYRGILSPSGDIKDVNPLNEFINLKNYTSTQPSLGLDKKGNQVLYFISDQPRGQGGLDIWYAIYDSRTKDFGRPQNLGSKINSAKDEMSPYYDNKLQHLFFSSEGGVGFGGFDIFKTGGQGSRFKQIENLGYPINSGADDLYYMPNAYRDGGMLVSNRKGSMSLRHATCCDDIYEFKMNVELHFALDGNLFIDENGEPIAPLDKATVSLYEINDSLSQDILIADTISNSEGFFFFDLEHEKSYRIGVRKKGYLSYLSDSSITTRGLRKSDTLHHEAILVKRVPRGPVVLENIYYDFDSPNLTETSFEVLDTTLLVLLKENPHLKVEIGSHTDNLGNDDYNMKLSQRRAESVVKYLIANGVSPEQLIAKGYGETNPVAANQHPNGKDNPAGRQKNRRTEFKIIGEIDLGDRVESWSSLDTKEATKEIEESVSKSSREEMEEEKEINVSDVQTTVAKESEPHKDNKPTVNNDIEPVVWKTEEVEDRVDTIKEETVSSVIAGENNSQEPEPIEGEQKMDKAAETPVNEVFFTIQVAASKSHLSNYIERFNGLEDVWYKKWPDGYYRYYSGKFANFNLAEKYKNSETSLPKGAYFTAIRNGKKITIKEAKSLTE